MLDPTQRFSNRVDNYIQYRPSYPQAIIPLLAASCGLAPAAVIADIGSGTGILTRLFLENGNPVFGVEPNRAMRAAGEALLRGYPHFTSIAATAEATTLPDQCVDFVTAGQAFHWFDPERARAEFLRILKPWGWVVLVWNERHTDSTPFLVAYERLLERYAIDYDATRHTRFDDGALRSFYRSDTFQVRTIENSQTLDWESLRGRLLSSSYIPLAGQPGYEAMLELLATIFRVNQSNGQVIMAYDTKVYTGQLDTP
jgi:SAM-dependent methyltransferase